MMGSYKFPKHFEEIVIVDGLEREVLIVNFELHPKW